MYRISQNTCFLCFSTPPPQQLSSSKSNTLMTISRNFKRRGRKMSCMKNYKYMRDIMSDSITTPTPPPPPPPPQKKVNPAIILFCVNPYKLTYIIMHLILPECIFEQQNSSRLTERSYTIPPIRNHLSSKHTTAGWEREREPHGIYTVRIQMLQHH